MTVRSYRVFFLFVFVCFHLSSTVQRHPFSLPLDTKSDWQYTPGTDCREQNRLINSPGSPWLLGSTQTGQGQVTAYLSILNYLPFETGATGQDPPTP